MTNLTMLSTTVADAVSMYNISIDEIDDQLRIMQRQESTSYHPTDYLNHGDLTTSFKEGHRTSRSAMCTWCHQLTDVTNLSRLAVSRAMNYLDRFVSSEHKRARSVLLNKKEYQLAAITCLYIAIKLFEPLALDASLLAEISAGCYTTEEVVDMENCILDALEWRMNGPTSQEFVCHLLALLNPEEYGYNINSLGTLLDVAKFQCELAAADYDLSLCKPSVVALASILNSIEGMNEELLLSSKAQHVFMTRICGMMPNLDMAQVSLVQARLRQLSPCQNSRVVDVSHQDDAATSVGSSSRRSSDSGSDSSGGSITTSSRSMKSSMVSCQADCSSPAIVVICSQLDHRECIAKCA